MSLSSREKKDFINSLEFLFFIEDLRGYLRKNDETENRAIKRFIDLIEDHCRWSCYNVKYYLAILMDYVFWQSREFYLKTMKEFISHELTGREFSEKFFWQILKNRKEYQILEKDFKKQRELELDPKIYNFSKILDDFYLLVSAFDGDEEPDEGESVFLTENKLRQIVKDVLPRLEKYFIEET